MVATLPVGAPPWFGLDSETLRFLEIHQARAVAIAGRRTVDCGDSFLLHSPADRDPFFNRLVAVRWPDAAGAFDNRLAEAISLFAAVDRQPYVWLVPGLSTPGDIVARLVSFGFRDLGGGYDMLLVRTPDTDPSPLPDGYELRHVAGGRNGLRAGTDAGALARAIAAGFGVDESRVPGLVGELRAALQTPAFHGCILTVDGRDVATGQRFTFDGASYLSSIATHPGHRGRGYGSIVTEALVRASLAEGCRYVYLGVHAGNEPAIRLYERLGFAVLGPRSSDLLLE